MRRRYWFKSLYTHSVYREYGSQNTYFTVFAGNSPTPYDLIIIAKSGKSLGKADLKSMA
jgi:hypothetical protein